MPDGCFPTMITPFDEAGNVDMPLLEALTEWYLASDVAGLFAVCLSSEMFQLSDKERLRIAKCVYEKVGQRVPVVATGTFGGSIEEMANFTKQIAEHCDAVGVVTAFFAEEGESDEVWLHNAQRFCELTGDIPLGLYECPVPYKRLLSPDMVQWCAETNRFCFHKDTCCDLDQIKAKLTAIPRNCNFKFYNANVETLQASLLLGAHGFCGICANFYPWMVARLCHQVEGDVANRIQDFLAVAENVVVPGYPRSAKVFLSHMGFPITDFCRKPGVEVLGAVKRRQIQHMYNLMLNQCKPLGIEVQHAAKFLNRMRQD